MRIDRRSLLQASAVMAASAAVARRGLAQQGNHQELQKNLDAVLQAAVERGDVPGVIGAITDRNGTIYEGAFGERRLGSGVPMTMDTVTHLASMTKPITAAAAMQLVEQGELELDVPISRWAPDAARLQVLDGWDDKGEPILRAPVREVTLRHLMTHTSGFAYNLWDADLDRYMKEKNLPALDSGEEAAFYPPLMFDPGERWEYGISIDWIGKLVEVVSGKSLGTYMHDHIFVPLGMDSTSYRISPDMEARRASVHQRGSAGVSRRPTGSGSRSRCASSAAAASTRPPGTISSSCA
jgi:methyl acetate hydrolase